MKVLIKNCSSDARSICKYMTYCSLMFKPYQEIEIECNSEKEVEYYKQYANVGFKVMTTAEEIHDHHNTTTSQSEVVQSSKSVEKSTAEETKDNDMTNGDSQVKVPENNSDGLDSLSIDQLKTIIYNLGLTTNYRAAWKLVQLIRSNIPDGKTYLDYIN